MEIQQALVTRGLHPGPANGVWGDEWIAALKQFQQQQNLNPDGKLGALSLIALGLGPKREPIAQFAGKPESGK
jgi:peptidoglycan hydrolase-like protein with peptidoglycan-binding domain